MANLSEEENINEIDGLLGRVKKMISGVSPIDLSVYPFFDGLSIIDSANHNNAGFTLKMRIDGNNILHPFKGVPVMQRLKVTISNSLDGILYDDEAMMLRWSETSSTGQDVKLRLSLLNEKTMLFLDKKSEKVTMKTWILNDDETLAEKPRRKWHEYSAAEQSGILCDDQAFRNYLFGMIGNEEQRGFMKSLPSKEQNEACAMLVRRFCGVSSRSLINPDTEDGRGAFQRWQRLLSGFREVSNRFG